MFNRDPNRVDRFDATGRPTPGYVTPNTLGGGVRVGTGAIPREGFLTASFVWMFVGLLVSAGAGLFVMSSQSVLDRVVQNWFVLVIGELGLVFGLSIFITRINAMVALGLFFVYALLNGLTIGAIVLQYVDANGMGGVVSAFAGSSAIFAGAAAYGVVTKRDLTSLGGILFMGLIGLIVVSFVQLIFFPGGGLLSFLIGVVGVVLFTGLTAWHVQKIKSGQMGVLGKESASVMGALVLYLDFVNLFLMMLRIFGGNNR